jgi:RimJ/RimL family protein N-acetyltransferase
VIAVDATDQVVGWCDIVRYQREGYRHAGVLGIGLVPGFRERGLGARLALASIDAARRNGIERIELEVLASNERAIALYRQLGFVDEGVKRGARKLDGRYEDKLFMALLDAPASR